ncbi:tyrosine-type recombinase/integrase [Undibacterium sp. Ji50W]|uniref:tyrosine-type recombinase/integrase n=1 Tax=Undibacterium sp. Ji50W TaxID=3413041 RepID=UPI003BF41188
MKLTIKAVVAAKPQDAAYKLSDGNGLYLYVSPAGTKVWRANYVHDGKQKTATYGQYPAVSLAQARQINADRKAGMAAQAKAVPTFKQIAERWLVVKLQSLSNDKHKKQIPSTLEEYVYPDIGDRPIDQIKRADLVAVVQKISRIPETAHRVAGRICSVFDFAQDSGVIENHPAAGLSRVLPSNKVKKPRGCIPPTQGEVKALFAAIDTYEESVTLLALKFIAHTFVRTIELRGMRWSEVDFANMVWVIPEERMKLRIPHVVPLTRQTVAILEELKKYSSESDLVVESPIVRGSTISENTMLFALYRLGYRGRMTVHGFRVLASTVLNQQPQFSADAIERQLAHKESDEVRAAYHRAEYLPQRRDIMTWWSDWLDAQCNC